jgi:hypothetical protein
MKLADDHHMGIKLTRETASNGDISVYFGKGVTQREQGCAITSARTATWRKVNPRR